MREFRVVSVGHVGTRRPQPRTARRLPPGNWQPTRPGGGIPGSASTTEMIRQQIMIEEHLNANQPAKGVLGGAPAPTPGPAPASTPTAHPGYAAPAPSLMDRLKQGRK